MENIEKLTPSLMQALYSPRPTLCSLYQGEHAKLALNSRSIPNLRYDPDQGDGWPSGLDISLNPDWEKQGIIGKLHPKGPEEELTFCHYAWARLELRGEFTALEAGEETTPIADYLRLNAKERTGKIPALQAGDGEEPEAFRPSARLLHYAMDKAQLWASLQKVMPEKAGNILLDFESQKDGKDKR